MKPSIGRIVHYVSQFNGNHVAAIVVRVWSDTCVNLRVFYDGTNDAPDGESEWHTSRTLDESADPQKGTWHWPEKV